MALADIVIIVLLLIFALGGLRRGLVGELFTTVGLLLGCGVVYYFHADLIQLTYQFFKTPWQRQWGGALIFLFFFLLVYLGFSAIGSRLREGISKTPFKWPDRILGVALGALKGAVLIALVVVAVEWFDASGRLRVHFRDSTLIRWGKRAVHELIYWESPAHRKWVEAVDRWDGEGS